MKEMPAPKAAQCHHIDVDRVLWRQLKAVGERWTWQLRQVLVHLRVVRIPMMMASTLMLTVEVRLM